VRPLSAALATFWRGMCTYLLQQTVVTTREAGPIGVGVRLLFGESCAGGGVAGPGLAGREIRAGVGAREKKEAPPCWTQRFGNRGRRGT